MKTHSKPGSVSRRVFIAGAAAGIFALPRLGTAHQATDLDWQDAAGLLLLIRESPDLSEASSALTEVFARSGIGVFTDDASIMIRPLKAEPSPLAFTESQVASMVDELRAGGYRGAGEWNGLAPESTETGEAMPSLADFYAGYGWRSSTPGADFARQLIWEMPIGHGLMESGGLPAPRAAMAVMSGEILAGLQSHLASAPTSAPGVPSIPTLPGLPDLPPVGKVYDLPPLPELNDAACANIRAFVTTVIQRVLSVLENTRDVVTIPLLNEIFSGFLDAIDFGLKVIVRAIDIVIEPVMSVLKSIAAAVALASSILGTVTPWTVAIAATPNMTRLGVGPAEIISGDVQILAGGADNLPWPPVVTGCAAALNLPVPKRTSANTPVFVEIQNPSDRELVQLGQEPRLLDDAGLLTIGYVTTNETRGQIDTGDEEIGVVYITATIDREDLRQFSQQLVDILLAELPTIIADVLRDLTRSTVAALRENILALTTAQATTRMYVTYHREHCLHGEYMVMNMTTFLTAHTPEVLSASGRIHWWFNTDGACSMRWDGVKATFSHGGKATYAGVAEGTYAVDTGIVQITFTSSNAMEHTTHPDAGDHDFPLDAPWLTQEFGTWSLACGDTVYMGHTAQRYVMWLGPVVA